MSRDCSLPTSHHPTQHLSPFLAGGWAAVGHLLPLEGQSHKGQMTPYMEKFILCPTEVPTNIMNA